MTAPASLVALGDVRGAAAALDGLVHRTPVVGSEYFSRRIGASVLLKLESFQKTGSFKVRGALNVLRQLGEAERRRGVISLSAGNHAQSLAYAATRLGVASTLVMPATARRSKIEATEGYGGRVVLTDGDLLQTTLDLQREGGQTLVHPFDDPRIIAGAGTVGLEILAQAPDVDLVVAGVGGGGLISGLGAALKRAKPSVRVVGVEPVGANAMTRSLAAGRPERLERIDTVADGLAAPFAGVHTLAHVQRFVDEVVQVSDEEIMGAVVALMERCKLVVEPAAAACVAALVGGQISVKPGEGVVCVISGGNVGASDLRRLLPEG